MHWLTELNLGGLLVSALWVIMVPGFCHAGTPEDAEGVGGQPSSWLQYPKKIKVPDNLPSVEVVRYWDTTRRRHTNAVFLPPAEYLQGHYAGWQDCLDDYAISMGMNPLIVGSAKDFQLYSQQGERDGYMACASRITNLVRSGVSESKIRKLCSQLYRPLTWDEATDCEKKRPTGAGKEELR